MSQPLTNNSQIEMGFKKPNSIIVAPGNDENEPPSKRQKVLSLQTGKPLSQETLDYCEAMKKKMLESKTAQDVGLIKRINDKWKQFNEK